MRHWIDLSEARVYSDLLFTDCPGLIEVRPISPGRGVDLGLRDFAPTVDRAVVSIRAAADDNCNVYVGVATRCNGASGDKKNLCAVLAVWVDVDFKADGAREAFEIALERFPFPPSLIVFSGGGWHVYWILTEPFDLTTAERRFQFECVLKGVCDFLNGDRSATDSSRILRVPGTVNRLDAKKRAEGRKPALACILKHDQHRYHFDDFADFEERGRRLSSSGHAEGSGAGYESANYKGALPDSVESLARLNAGARRLLGERFEALGHPSESEADFELACLLARCGIPGGEIENALRWRRRSDAWKTGDYFARTARKALDGRAAPDDPSEGQASGADDGLEGDATAQGFATQRPIIQLADRQLDDVLDDAIDAIVRANHPPELFMRGGAPVVLRADDLGACMIVEAGDAALVERLARTADWFKKKRAAGPTRELAGTIAARLAQFPDRLPALVGVTESPLLRADGSILERPGYDAASKLFYAPRAAFRLAPVPDHPTLADVAAAVALLDDAIGEFPFCGDADRAAMLAAVVTIPARDLIPGCVPATLFDAPAPGTGKGLAVDVIATIATGGGGAKMAEPDGRSDDEMRKRITALAIEGRRVIVLDNVERPIGSASLALALTAEVISDRLLGRSQNVTLPNRAVWLITGNNLRLRGDLPRRCVPCRLDARLARPWAREGFRHPDLLAWVREHRGELLAAVFTLVRAWIAEERPGPAVGVPPLGSFEGWRSVVGGILNVADVAGFLGNLGDLYDSADDDVNAWTAFLIAWRARFPDAAISVKKLLEELAIPTSKLAEAIPLELAEAAKKTSAAKRIGKALARKVETRFPIGDGAETLRIVRELDSHSKSVRWGIAK